MYVAHLCKKNYVQRKRYRMKLNAKCTCLWMEDDSHSESCCGLHSWWGHVRHHVLDAQAYEVFKEIESRTLRKNLLGQRKEFAAMELDEFIIESEWDKVRRAHVFHNVLVQLRNLAEAIDDERLTSTHKLLLRQVVKEGTRQGQKGKTSRMKKKRSGRKTTVARAPRDLSSRIESKRSRKGSTTSRERASTIKVAKVARSTSRRSKSLARVQEAPGASLEARVPIASNPNSEVIATQQREGPLGSSDIEVIDVQDGPPSPTMHAKKGTAGDDGQTS